MDLFALFLFELAGIELYIWRQAFMSFQGLPFGLLCLSLPNLFHYIMAVLNVYYVCIYYVYLYLYAIV